MLLHHPLTRASFSVGIVLLVILSANSVGGVAAGGSTGRSGPALALVGSGSAIPPAATPINTTLSVGGLVGNLSPDFWGTTVSNEVHLLRGETDSVNATPARVIVWPGAMAGEDYDPLTGTHYNTYDGTPTPALTSEAQFVEMCKAIQCISIMQLPAEIDNPSYAEEIVNYTEVNLSFHPSYWMLGNEPELWSHWKVPWKNWGTTYTTGPTPTQFGDEVLAYLAKIRQVDNTTPILGLPASGCTCGYWTFSQWIASVLAVTGSKIQAVAFHEYPAGWLGTGDGSLFDFYGTIQSSVNIPTRMASARAAVQTACPGCNVSVFISELGSALSWSAYGQYAAGFSGALSIAAQMTQAMDVNLTNIDLFATELATTNSWFNPGGYARPDYPLYTQVLDHLGTAVYPVNFTGLGKTLYGIDTSAPNDSERQDLLVVNANITSSIAFTPQFADGAQGSPTEAWYWNGSIHSTKSNSTTWVEPYTPNPIPQLYPGGVPSTYVLPPQSMVLFETYPSEGTFVRVAQAGVPAGTPWYASLGSRFYSTTEGNMSLLLRAGAYPFSGASIPLPIGGRELNPSERLAPFAPSPAIVGGRYTNLTLSFVPQWRVNVSASPSTEGTAVPDVGWWNASQPLTLTATPLPGDAFLRWSGWGPGSYNGSSYTATIVPTGRVNETAHFEVGLPSIFWAVNLPGGSRWSVTVRNITTNSTASSMLVYSPAGTWAYHITPPAHYRVIPQNGSFVASGAGTFIEFFPITPPQPTFPVQFETTGLPSETTVNVTVRSVTQIVGAPVPQFQLINGTYAYQLGYVPGFHANVSLKTFDVQGGPLTVIVPFVPTFYSVTWEAQGVRLGLNWSVIIDGTTVSATSAWVSTSLLNGSHAFAVLVPENYTSSPRTGLFEVNGSRVVVSLNLSLQMFAAGFEALGPGSTDGWSVRLGNLTQPATENLSDFLEANGTYTFDVHAPDGYYAVPSHGSLTVAGSVPRIQVHFYLISEKPSAALVAALTSGAFMVSGWIALSVVLGFLVVRTLRRRRGA